jgi:hypothetical protein
MESVWKTRQWCVFFFFFESQAYSTLSLPPCFQILDRVPWRAGIPRDWTSDLEKFEALDPAEWCPRGYAIVNVDSRGVFDSDGDMFMLGTQVSGPNTSHL